MMSGDVQPRKRKDKRRKKDELGVEEPRGTAAVFGEGDVLMHSHHEHSTGGHWCAKIIFFSLLSVLVTLIVLIILENRGLTELEANSVESRYSGVLDGWIEDTADDDHHDEHTLDLKHHSYEDVHDDGDDDNQKEVESEQDEDDHEEEELTDENEDDDTDGDGADDDDDEDDEDEEQDEDDEEHDDDEDDKEHDNKYDTGYEDKDEDNSDEKNVEEDDDDEDDERMEYKKYTYDEQAGENDDDDDDENEDDDEDNHIENNEDLIDNDSREEQDDEDSKEDLKDFNQDDDNKSNELQDDDDNDSIETNGNRNDDDDENDDNENEDDDDNEIENEDDDEEVERIEREVVDEEEAMSDEKPDDNVEINEEDDNDDEEKEEINDEDDDTPDDDEDIIEPLIVEQIPVPTGKPFVELEDEPSSEKPSDTLAEEEEYEKRQEQIRLEKEESSSQMWLKLAVGGALLLATHAVVRRSAAPGDTAESEDSETREETPTLIDRRMTLLPRETPPLLTPETREPVQEIVERLDSIKKAVQSVPVRKQESDDDNEDEREILKEEIITKQETKDVLDKELYSDEEEEVEDEEEIVEEKELSNDVRVETEKEAEDSEAEEVPDDVEIIDDEQIEEEIEDEEEDEEEVSDVDDGELLSRLEAKYGRLPEPERPARPAHRHSKRSMFEDGGNSIEYDWPGEPSSPYWRKQLDIAEEEIRQREFAAARARVARPLRAGSVRARYLHALALDKEAERLRNNDLLMAAVRAYLQILNVAHRLSDKLLTKLATKTLEKIYFRGNYRSAEPVYRLLMYRFPNNITYRHNLTVLFLMTNNLGLAEDLLNGTMKLWPNDRLSLAQYGFILKVRHKRLEQSVEMFSRALENDEGAACEPRFYYHLGDALLLLGRYEEAGEVHERAAEHGHFLSAAQRSLYNVDRLTSRPWWRLEDTPYVALAKALERSWKEILKEGEAARALYEKEREGLKERGEWSQLDLFVRGQEVLGRCKRAPVTCSIVRAEPAAAGCRRGQVKFSLMAAGTRVRPHVGPTNCRLRMHLGLSNTKHTYIRVDKEIRQWQLGKVLLFDDSFEHEVWHNGTGTRLVLIVDVWHPELSAAERRQLPAI